ncbi:MAG: hypothetical protein OXC37_00365 [Bdellovibrionaceae bacterium]|nr:hypothetical protein [Pseudobdellovibrionaceae bacterium]
MKLLVFLSLFLIHPTYANEDLIGEWELTENTSPEPPWYDKLILVPEIKEIKMKLEDQTLIENINLETLFGSCSLEIVSPYAIVNNNTLRAYFESEESFSVEVNCLENSKGFLFLSYKENFTSLLENHLAETLINDRKDNQYKDRFFTINGDELLLHYSNIPNEINNIPPFLFKFKSVESF